MKSKEIKADSRVKVSNGQTTIKWRFENGIEAYWMSSTKMLTVCSNNIVLDKYTDVVRIDELVNVLLTIQKY